MLLISRIGRTLLLALCLCAGLAQAALPDPVALSWAIERNDVKQVTAWLDGGLDPEYQASQIGSGLMIAAWHGRVEMMALFVERGANPRRANGNGEQPLQLAAWNGHLEAVKWLLDHGALLNRDGNYWGALHYAVFNGHRDLARFLIDRGADINGRSPNGSTPLMMAAREGREELAGDLLAAGADPKAKSDWGDDALTLAMRYDHYSLGKMISSAEEFSAAVKAPKESFGEPVRSASAPSEIEVLLARIHEAEGEGRPSEELHKKLMEEVSKLRRNAVVVSSARRPMPIPFQSRSLVITAKRGKPGAERAQVVVGKPAVPVAAGKVVTNKSGAITITPVDQRARQARVAEIMRQIRLYEAEGRPSEGLRRELYEAVEALK